MTELTLATVLIGTTALALGAAGIFAVLYWRELTASTNLRVLLEAKREENERLRADCQRKRTPNLRIVS